MKQKALWGKKKYVDQWETFQAQGPFITFLNFVAHQLRTTGLIQQAFDQNTVYLGFYPASICCHRYRLNKRRNKLKTISRADATSKDAKPRSNPASQTRNWLFLCLEQGRKNGWEIEKVTVLSIGEQGEKGVQAESYLQWHGLIQGWRLSPPTALTLLQLPPIFIHEDWSWL